MRISTIVSRASTGRAVSQSFIPVEFGTFRYFAETKDPCSVAC